MAGFALQEVFEQSFELQEAVSLIQNESERKRCYTEYIDLMSGPKSAVCPDFDDGLTWFNTDTPLSLRSHLKKKVVVLDFFTYCCINCMHILPDLKSLEEKHTIADGLVVLGVHSAKFDNEKVSSNILSAVLRYGITHPVVNDEEGKLWTALNIGVWPTLVILGPDSKILFVLAGEGHSRILEEFVAAALAYYGEQEQISSNDIPLKLSKNSLPPSVLSFPGKLSIDPTGSKLAISDTGHHRIIVTDISGVVQEVIGATEPGFQDGSVTEARFRAPQGLCWWDSNTIFVADTENHAIRKVDLNRGVVTTVVGTGRQGSDLEGGQQGTQQPISSPWDVLVGKTTEGRGQVLYIAMAGSHQLWVYCLEDAILLKNKSFCKGTCTRLVGSGSEENRNNRYPHKAGLAQPSGLAMMGSDTLFVADSESSTVRRVSLQDGGVTGVVGGERDPRNLFAFGDVDGKGILAKLQHPLAVAVLDEAEGLLLVADSYNHKVKEVNVKTQECKTVLGTGSAGQTVGPVSEGAQLSEPGGLSMHPTTNCLYIADTNNHGIKVFDMRLGTLSELHIIFAETTDGYDEADAISAPQKRLTSKLNAKVITLEALDVKTGSKVTLTMDMTFGEGLHLTEGAPSAWQIVQDDTSEQLLDPTFMTRQPLSDLSDKPVIVFSVPVDWTDNEATLSIEYILYCCNDSGACMMKGFVFQLPVRCAGSDRTSEITRSIEQCIEM